MFIIRKIKTIYKILILCISIFILGLYIAKISIDSTFNKVECNQVVEVSINKILQKTIQVKF